MFACFRHLHPHNVHTADKKHKKLEKYGAAKRRSFLASLMPPVPETESEFVRNAMADLTAWTK